MRRWPIVGVILVILATACADVADTTATPVPDTSAAPASSTSQAPTTTTAAATTTTTMTTTVAPTTTITLPGEPVDFGPRAGDELAVVGVRFDDILNLRVAPGADQAIVAELPPDFTAIVARGNTRTLPRSFWYEVEAVGLSGWVSARFVGFIGGTDDVTSTVVADLGGIPVAATMPALADMVANVLKSEEPPSTITVLEPATVGDVGEITIDIIGLGDDAVLGLRVVVIAEPTEDGFSLKAVEATALCGRGVTVDGLCV